MKIPDLIQHRAATIMAACDTDRIRIIPAFCNERNRVVHIICALNPDNPDTFLVPLGEICDAENTRLAYCPPNPDAPGEFIAEDGESFRP